MEDILYYKYLLDLLSNMEDNNNFHNELKINIYLTLLALNNHNYHEDFYQNELDIINNYLRKMNNLKVKIQLKRKDDEVNKLIKELENIYINNKLIINKYNKDSLDIYEIINSNNSKLITELIDKLTKEKIIYIRNKEKYDDIRKKITNLSFVDKYVIDGNRINIYINDSESINILLSDFYSIFDYLLNINNYKEIFLNNNKNNHSEIISKLIDTINDDLKIDNKLLIPIILYKIFNININNIENINTSNFKIDNIKITDLYSFANNNLYNMNTAKWKKVAIPNNYLYKKIKEIVSKGMYYFNNDLFILENIENNISDFKISISVNDMQMFLKDNLLHIINRDSVNNI